MFTGYKDPLISNLLAEPYSGKYWTMDDIKTIFLVEDNFIDTWIARKVFELSGMGREIICCGDADEAMSELEHFQNQHHCLPDLILVDISLPVTDGINLITKIKALPAFSSSKNIVVLVTEGLDSKYDLPRIQNEQIRYVIFKPLNHNKIQDIISEFSKDEPSC